MKILSFGSLNIDYTYSVEHIVQKGETLSSTSLEVFSGGKGLNQSIALAKAGAEVYMAGAVGKDGLFLLDLLKENNVNIEYTKVLDTIRTGNAIIQKDIHGENCILLYGGANQAIEKDYIDEVLNHFNDQDYLIIQNEINNLDYLVVKASQKGLKVILNPSPMNEKILALPLDKINYFILNEVEVCQILNEEYKDNGKELAYKMLEKYPDSHIILTLGSKGSIYIDQKNFYKQGIYKVQAVDTTAAGDTFSGYFFASILNGKGIPYALDLAAKASSIAVTRLGAAPSIPLKEEVEAC